MKTELKSRNATAKAIEENSFAFEFISKIATKESWRKEVFRPIYHVHKWWAKRLGSVFRGIVLGSVLPKGTELEEEFYKCHSLTDKHIFDPFMGSGTTIGEAAKLGCIAIGRDINPIACEGVRISLGSMDKAKILKTYRELEETVGKTITDLYKTRDAEGKTADVLYWFWVKEVDCIHCGKSVSLFPSQIFSRNAYQQLKPEVKICCPKCGDIIAGHYKDTTSKCSKCGFSFNPQVGAVTGSTVSCGSCGQSFKLLSAIKKLAVPPKHRLYAKLVLQENGEKAYLPITEEDRQAYRQASEKLNALLAKQAIRLPDMEIKAGNNTDQVLNYNYHNWREFFNDRQLLALGLLQAEIAKLHDVQMRDLFLNLFSGLLEFNNMFASYKGEGTGAVRHMFAHHILKPEKMPIEANVWGTPKSSGAFSGLFRTRVLRALDYQAAPFEISAADGEKVYTCNKPLTLKVSQEEKVEGKAVAPNTIYLSCGSSSKTRLPDKSIDAVITDPPFFDNVNYSELADFFFAWQSLYPRGFIASAAKSTRHVLEVQDSDSEDFSKKLEAVFKECARVLKDDGLLAFTYHHSRNEGWESLGKAIFSAGFYVVNCHPIKAEMSGAVPKNQAKAPIQLDIVIVCRKFIAGQEEKITGDVIKQTHQVSLEKARRLTKIGLTLSLNDCRVIMFGQFLVKIRSQENLGLFKEYETQMLEASNAIFSAVQKQTEKGLDSQEG